MRPPAASTNRRVERRDAGEALQEVERGPLGGQHRAGGTADLGDDVPVAGTRGAIAACAR